MGKSAPAIDSNRGVAHQGAACRTWILGTRARAGAPIAGWMCPQSSRRADVPVVGAPSGAENGAPAPPAGAAERSEALDLVEVDSAVTAAQRCPPSGDVRQVSVS